jgi:hypothetical protein
MKTRNPTLSRPARQIQGQVSGRAAGSRGITFRDASTAAHPVRDLLVVGGTITDNDDGTAILTIGGGGGTPGTDFISSSGGGGYVVYSNSAAGSALTLDLSVATVFDITLTANCTLTFTNAPNDGEATEWTLIIRQGGVGSFTVTWPAAVQWQDSDGTPGGAAPVLFTAVDAVDVVKITSLDGGATYGGASVRGDFDLLLNKPSLGASALDGLTDVVITTPTAADRLRFDGSEWVNSNLHWEPMVDYDGLVMLDSAGGIHVHEVSH